MGVGGMIGGGIFSVLGLAVDVSGHSAPFAFLIGSVIATVAAYSYTRLSLTFQSDGASFTYLERAFPNHLAVAGIAGRTVVVGYIGTLSLYAFTFGAYGAHLTGYADSGFVRVILSLSSLVVFALINLIGAKAMGKAEDIVVYVKIALLAILAGVGFFAVDTTYFTPVVNKGVSSIFLGGALIFVAYEGFQLITNSVMETKNPDKNISRGMFGSIMITSAIYIAIAIVAVGTLKAPDLKAAQEYALAVVAKPVMGRIGVVLVDVAALLATSSAINATLFGASRMAQEMAVDTLAPKAFSFRNRHQVPAFGVLLITSLAAILTSLGGLEMIAAFSSMTFLLVSIGVTIANFRLRRQTKSNLTLIVLGLALMGTTVVLLTIFLSRNNVTALVVSALIYISAALAHFLFTWMQHRHKSAP